MQHALGRELWKNQQFFAECSLRATRRWLRAVEHRIRTSREATLTPAHLAGWRALQHMITARR